MHDWLLLPDHKCLFVRGKAKNRLFGAKNLCFKVAALRVKQMSVNDFVHQVFVLKMMDGAISAVKSKCGHFWSEFMSKTWHTVV